jgi:hypothetical protein
MDADLLERLNEIFGRCLETELKLPWILWAVSPASGRTAVLRIHGAGKPYEVLAGDPGLEDFALPLTIVVVDQRKEILPARIEVSGETTWALIPRPNHNERTRLRGTCRSRSA